MNEQNTNETGRTTTGRRSSGNSYYSVNLTEGRIFLIFAGVIGFIVLGAFVLLFVFSNINKNRDDQIAEDSLFEFNTTGDLAAGYSSSAISSVDLSVENLQTETDQVSSASSSGTLSEPVRVESNSNNINQPILNNEEILYSSRLQMNQGVSGQSSISAGSTNNNTGIARQTVTNRPQSVQTASSSSRATTTISVSSRQTTNSTVSNKRFVIQVGAFSSKTNAETIEQFYKQSGYPAYIVETVNNNRTLYRLRVGPFSEKGMADSYLADIKSSQYGSNSYISIVYM